MRPTRTAKRPDAKKESALGAKKEKKIGLARGAAQEKRVIAKNFKKSGIPLDVIAQNTGLSPEEIEAL